MGFGRFSRTTSKGGAGIGRGNSAAESGQFFLRGKAALRRQLVDEAWHKLRQLRGHFLFGQACLFRQSLNKRWTKRRSERARLNRFILTAIHPGFSHFTMTAQLELFEQSALSS